MNTTSPTAAIPYDSDEVSDHKQAFLDQIRDNLRTDLDTGLAAYGHALATVRCAPEGLAVIRDECGDVLRAVADEYVGQGWAVNEGMVNDLHLEAAGVDYASDAAALVKREIDTYTSRRNIAFAMSMMFLVCAIVEVIVVAAVGDHLGPLSSAVVGIMVALTFLVAVVLSLVTRWLRDRIPVEHVWRLPSPCAGPATSDFPEIRTETGSPAHGSDEEPDHDGQRTLAGIVFPCRSNRPPHTLVVGPVGDLTYEYAVPVIRRALYLGWKVDILEGKPLEASPFADERDPFSDVLGEATRVVCFTNDLAGALAVLEDARTSRRLVIVTQVHLLENDPLLAPSLARSIRMGRAWGTTVLVVTATSPALTKLPLRDFGVVARVLSPTEGPHGWHDVLMRDLGTDPNGHTDGAVIAERRTGERFWQPAPDAPAVLEPCPGSGQDTAAEGSLS